MGKMHDALKKAHAAREDAGTAVANGPTADELARGPSPGSWNLPRTRDLSGEMDPHLVPLRDPRSPVAEQYRALRTNILALSPDDPLQVLTVTSAVPNEGKSVSSVNLACVLAEESDRKVVLVDADMRKPDVHRLLGIDNQRGLSDYLSGGTMLEMVLQRSRLPNLWVLPAGCVPGNPTDLLGGKRMEDLLARLRRDYDMVIIDTPPVIATADAGVLGPRVDGTILVVRMHSTPRDVSRTAAETLQKARADIVGLLLTGVEGTSQNYYYYAYGTDEDASVG